MSAVCTYSLDKCKASEIIDVVGAHQIAIIKKQDRWQPIESSERKQAQQKIREAHQYADKIIETVREPFLVLDKNLKVVSANDYFYESFNVKPEETDGEFIYNLGNRQWDIPKLRELLHEILPKKNSFENFEVKHDFPNIGPKRMLLNARQVDEVQLILLAIEDTTELKKAEEESRQARDYTENIFNYSNVPIIFWDKELKIIRFNHAFEHLTGYTANEVIGQRLSMLFPEATRDESLQKIAGTLSGEYWESVEIPILCKGADVRIVLWNSANIYAEDGTTLLSTIAQGVDITELKNREEELKESEQRFRRIFEEVTDGIILADPETKKFYFGNKTFYQMIGYNEEEIKGLGVMDIHPQEAMPYVLEQFEKQRRREIALAKDLPVKRKDGSVFYADVNSASITLAGKAYLMGIFRDVTERKKAEEALQELNKELESTVLQLRRSNEELKDFAHIIAHDLKEPLRAITTLADWISTDYADKLGDDGRDLINSLLVRVDRMYSLIGGILQYSKIGSVTEGQFRVDLNELVSEVIDMVAPPENVTITVENHLPVIKCEKACIIEVFQNLLSNAVKYMDKPQGEVRIGCVEENGFWKFSIDDNGPGIEERHYERIFQIFKTLQPRDKFESTGIGLAVAKKIVERCGGQIWVESEPGKGSTFFFTLPKQEIGVASAKLEAHIAC